MHTDTFICLVVMEIIKNDTFVITSVDEEIEVQRDEVSFLLHKWKIYIYYTVLNVTGIDYLVYLGTGYRTELSKISLLYFFTLCL